MDNKRTCKNNLTILLQILTIKSTKYIFYNPSHKDSNMKKLGKFFFFSFLLISLTLAGFLNQTPVMAETQESSFLKMASWNIRILSNSRTDDELRKIGNVAQKFDFISIVELRDEQVLKRLVAILRNEFGKIYQYELSLPVGGVQKELYAFLYNTDYVHVVMPGKLFDDSAFFRKPYYATFRSRNFDFTVIVNHIVWGNSVTERRKEINRLSVVYQTIQDADPHENDVLIVGDFNREPDDDLAWGPLRSLTGMINLFQLPEKSMIWDTNLYDNIWFQSHHVREYSLDKGIVRFDETDFGNDDTSASKAVSDHRPVWALFNINGPDDD